MLKIVKLFGGRRAVLGCAVIRRVKSLLPPIGDPIMKKDRVNETSRER